MVENRPWLTILSHLILLFGVGLVAYPIWVTFVASTHEGATLVSGVVPFWPGDSFMKNYSQILGQGVEGAVLVPGTRATAAPVAVHAPYETPEQRRAGCVTASSGNHGAAIA